VHRRQRPRKFSRFAALLVAFLAIGPGSRQRAVCAPQEAISRPDFAIANFRPPPGWEVLPQDRQSYPQLLAWASRGQGGDRAVMTLVGKRLMPGTSVDRFAFESAALKDLASVRDLRRQVQLIDGFSGRRVLWEGTLGEGPQRRVVCQIYLVNGPFGYVLTLVAPPSQALARVRDLKETADGLLPLPPQEALNRGAK
jgi:hypothetical protein